MFTGIVEEIGSVDAVQRVDNGVRLVIRAARVGGAPAGASIAINGVCQTVLEAGHDRFTVAAEMETLRVTTLGSLRPGSRVNLERALALGGRLDGHVVLGHVDGRAAVTAVRREGRTHVLGLAIPPDLQPYVVPKGCIAVDGVSLTVGARVDDGQIEVFLIPYTWDQTTLHERAVGDAVNVETDVLGRYVVELARRAGAGSVPDGGAARHNR